MTLSGHAAYYDQSSEYKTPVYWCRGCDLLYRDVERSKLVSHYYAASYVQDKNEERFLNDRIKFFDYILKLAVQYKPGQRTPADLTLVDFGSSYGHLLELAARGGFRPVGIELNEDLIASCTERGLVVFKEFSQLPDKVDIVVALDSVYCVSDPVELMAQIRECLKPGGILVTRVTNRNLYARMRSRFLDRGNLSAIGDATVSYSRKALLRLLSSSGFNVRKIVCDYGRGKRMGFKRRFFYFFSYVLTLLTAKQIILTPGIIVISEVGEKP
jgi:2-polyprenyl-3-methyl-5-hydroxy-6-metoxy-1,4-benzoquinol methylase